jgi:NtrC-family two-component system response regulator AlgB
LFGHVRGAFTGAFEDKRGRLEAADGSTVLFNEIAELPPSVQRKLLRFIEERRFERIGSNKTIRVDVRVIAASNRNLQAEVGAGRFREDLFYRLNVITFTLPPLRERSSDVLVLAHWMLKQATTRVNRCGLDLSAKAAEALLSYRWPGNLRELRNAVEHGVALAAGETIGLDDIPESVRNPASTVHITATQGTKLKDLEREHVLRALAENATLDQAATALGINAATLWRKRKRYGIS